MGRKASPSRVSHGINKRLGKRMKALRSELGMTQKEVAAKAEISTSHLNMLERGDRNASVAVLEAIAHALGKSVLEFLGEETKKPRVSAKSKTFVRVVSQLRELPERRLKAIETLIKAFKDATETP